MDGRAGGLTDGWAGRSEEVPGTHEEEADDEDAAANEDEAEEEDGKLEEGRRASTDVLGEQNEPGVKRGEEISGIGGWAECRRRRAG